MWDSTDPPAAFLHSYLRRARKIAD